MAEAELLPAYAPDREVEPPLVQPSARALLAYWRSKAAPGRFPRRGDLDPVEMKCALGDLAVIEVHRDPLRFRYRLHGATLAQDDGFDMTGKWLDDHPVAQVRGRLASSWRRVAEQGLIVHGFRDCFADALRPRRYEILVLPLADDGRTVDKLLVLQTHTAR